MNSRHEFNFSNMTFGNASNNPNQNNFYPGDYSTKISSNQSNPNNIINYDVPQNNIFSNTSQQEEIVIINPNQLINNVSNEEVQKIRNELMPKPQENGINYMTIFELKEQSNKYPTTSQFQGKVNNYVTAPTLQGQTNSEFQGKVNNYSTAFQLQLQPNNYVTAPQFQRQSNAYMTASLLQEKQNDYEIQQVRQDFPNIQKKEPMLSQINSYEYDNDYQNMMNKNKSKNNSNLNIFEEKKNSSYNSDNEFFKSLLERAISIEKKLDERMDEYNLKQEYLNNWFKNSVQRQEQHNLRQEVCIQELKTMNEKLENRLKNQEKLSKEMIMWLKSRFPDVPKKMPEDTKKK